MSKWGSLYARRMGMILSQTYTYESLVLSSAIVVIAAAMMECDVLKYDSTTSWAPGIILNLVALDCPNVCVCIYIYIYIYIYIHTYTCIYVYIYI